VAGMVTVLGGAIRPRITMVVVWAGIQRPSAAQRRMVSATSPGLSAAGTCGTWARMATATTSAWRRPAAALGVQGDERVEVDRGHPPSSAASRAARGSNS
jgi:hypothetical protein